MGQTKSNGNRNWPWIIKNPINYYETNQVWPKISIITPSFNQGEFIEETILSVINQNYPNLEYIIIDGGSTDETTVLIKKYEQHLSYWISEPDKGQADAINKGLKFCHGEIFNWINSDDLLEENALFHIANEFRKNSLLKLITGGCTHFTDQRNKESTYVRDLTFDGLISEKSYFQQPSQWLALQKLNLAIDSNLHYAFDWGMILNLELKENEISYLPINLSYFREHENAKTFKDALLFKYEKLEIVKKFLRKTTLLSRKKTLFFYHFKLSRYLKTIAQINKHPNLSFKAFLWFGITSPSILLNRFYLGHLKTLLLEKKN